MLLTPSSSSTSQSTPEPWSHMSVTAGDHYGEHTAPPRATPSPSLSGNDTAQRAVHLLWFLLAAASVSRNAHQSKRGRGETQYHKRMCADVVTEISPRIKWQGPSKISSHGGMLPVLVKGQNRRRGGNVTMVYISTVLFLAGVNTSTYCLFTSLSYCDVR